MDDLKEAILKVSEKLPKRHFDPFPVANTSNYKEIVRMVQEYQNK